MEKPVPVVICDDSKMARRHMVRALSGWNVDITLAEHGLEGLEAIRNGKGDLLFLDLNMPFMDGYDVLERIRRDDLPTMVIVVSGDVQPDARERVMALGAIDFIKKPFTQAQLTDVIQHYGILAEVNKPEPVTAILEAIELPDYYQEVANIAMGRAGERLSQLLHSFVHVPIPVVKLVTYPVLYKKFENEQADNSRMASQGFVGSGIAGEAILTLKEGSFEPLSQLMGKTFSESEVFENELMLEMANTLIGAFLQNFAEMLDIGFSWSNPILLRSGDHPMAGAEKWSEAFSITLDYSQVEAKVGCELMLIFSPESTTALRRLGNYLK
ncbi:MAG: response regulator [Pontibacterium sp.]